MMLLVCVAASNYHELISYLSLSRCRPCIDKYNERWHTFILNMQL